MQKAIAFLSENWAGVILIGLFLIFLFWGIGYFGNGLFNTKFELSSCWAGITCISAGGVIGAAKYFADSKYNTKEGEKP